MNSEKLLAIAALALSDDKDVEGLSQVEFCEKMGLKKEYYSGAIWKDMFLYFYKPSSAAPQPISEPEKRYTTKALIEKLNNALENGYEELGETDIGDLLLETEQESLCPHCGASPCLGEFDSSDCD